ncbi:DEAD/DEAH box helicase [Loa loa]|uniref:ATP-dependent RNA helicase n=1 Tax=Loa loa TaxID=7209 RepID=A0A1S0UMK3_LOALO|nr:DEAD/DEAH box helicase [Loa loa]EJD76077.1 DEAD/DEAH box helicase [Loa loa]
MDMSEVIRTMDVETDVPDFSSLMLNRTSLNALAKAGFTKPSPVQARAIPSGMLGLDLLVQAKSGTGKTMVFSLLAVENLNAQFGRPQVLIVAPTREIASQIVSYIRMLAPVVVIRMFVGGNEKGVAEDIQKLKKSIHIVVGTTGRLCHLVRINALRLSHVRLFVLDEADKLMEDNFQKEINYLFSALPPEKQVAVFSATYPYRLDTTLTRYMRDVHLVRVDRDAQLLGVKQYVIVARDGTRKMNILLRLLLRLRYGQCNELCADLHRSRFDAVSISGNMPQIDRTKAIRRLKNCMVKLLVSTDLTARGIDAPGVNIVINYGSPLVLATYLHRIGRAGRFGTQGAAFTIISSDQELKLFSDFVVEGKLRTKLLRARENWPSNLIYDDLFFSRSEDFRPYKTRNWENQQGHNDEKGEENAYEFMGTGSDLLECEEEASKFYEDKIALHQKSEKRIYSSQDFYNICRNMKNSEIPDTLLKKLVALKIQSPYNLDLTRKNTLMTLRVGTINKSKQDTNGFKRSGNEKPLCLLNIEAGFIVDMDTSIPKCYANCKKRRYLRNQILAIRNTLSDEDWLRYAGLRYGPAVRYEPFLICGFDEEGNKENIHEVKSSNSTTDCAGISDFKELEFANFDQLLLENLPKYEFDSGFPVGRSDEKYVRKSRLAGSSDLQELNPERDEVPEWKKNGAKYETSEDLRAKLAKVKSRFNYELILGLGKIKECMTTTEVPEICSMATQTENEGKLTETSSTQTNELLFNRDSTANHLDDYCSRRYMWREMDHFARYIKHLRGFKF